MPPALLVQTLPLEMPRDLFLMVTFSHLFWVISPTQFLVDQEAECTWKQLSSTGMVHQEYHFMSEW